MNHKRRGRSFLYICLFLYAPVITGCDGVLDDGDDDDSRAMVACCQNTGNCLDTPAGACPGTPLGTVSTCSQSVVRCCVGQQCVETPEECCTTVNAFVSKGPGECSPTVCTGVPSCLEQADCGQNETCVDGECLDANTIACCFGENCDELTNSACLAAAGEPVNAADCTAPNPCEDGACCTGTSCVATKRGNCPSTSTFLAGEQCSPNPCTSSVSCLPEIDACERPEEIQFPFDVAESPITWQLDDETHFEWNIPLGPTEEVSGPFSVIRATETLHSGQITIRQDDCGLTIDTILMEDGRTLTQIVEVTINDPSEDPEEIRVSSVTNGIASGFTYNFKTREFTDSFADPGLGEVVGEFDLSPYIAGSEQSSELLPEVINACQFVVPVSGGASPAWTFVSSLVSCAVTGGLGGWCLSCVGPPPLPPFPPGCSCCTPGTLAALVVYVNCLAQIIADLNEPTTP